MFQEQKQTAYFILNKCCCVYKKGGKNREAQNQHIK